MILDVRTTGKGVSQRNPLPTVTQKSNTTSLTIITSSTMKQLLLPHNPNRIGTISIYNSANSTLKIIYANTDMLSSSVFSVPIPSNVLYEVPTPNYTGPISGMWETDSPEPAYITEFNATT